jgi:hypothetical protein
MILFQIERLLTIQLARQNLFFLPNKYSHPRSIGVCVYRSIFPNGNDYRIISFGYTKASLYLLMYFNVFKVTFAPRYPV